MNPLVKIVAMNRPPESEEPIGVLLLNLGGPETLEDVRPFLFNLFSDPDIIRLPFRFMQKPLAWFISTQRFKKSSGYYAQIGGGSPLRKITDQQAQALETELGDRGVAAKVYVAMRYWHPFTEEAIEQIQSDGIRQLVVLPLYPQFSISTTGSSLNRLNQLIRQNGMKSLRSSVICSWQDQVDYIQSLAGMVREELAKFSNQSPESTTIVFSAHSVPVSYIEAGDPYLEYTRQTVEKVMQHLGARPHTLSFQSKVGPVKWLRPSTEEAIRRLADEGAKQLLLVPISFVSEHIETLYELDILYKGVADEVGIHEYRRVPALNCRPDFIGALANLVQNELRAETQSQKNLCPYYSVNCQPTPICKANTKM
jgi:protoporphyrin/coproporphyrin ferrochelatase